MTTLDTYNPIAAISLEGASLEAPKGIVVVVGPNSSGKTLFLRDIEKCILNGQTNFVVCTTILTRPPLVLVDFLNDLVDRHYVRIVGGNPSIYRTYVPFMVQALANEQNSRSDFTLDTLKKAFNGSPKSDGTVDPFYRMIGLNLLAQLTLDERRRVCHRSQSFDYQNRTPDVPLQGLYVNSKAQELLSNETGKVFGNAAWLDISENG
jgi:hypothetical protein